MKDVTGGPEGRRLRGEVQKVRKIRKDAPGTAALLRHADLVDVMPHFGGNGGEQALQFG